MNHLSSDNREDANKNRNRKGRVRVFLFSQPLLHSPTKRSTLFLVFKGDLFLPPRLALPAGALEEVSVFDYTNTIACNNQSLASTRPISNCPSPLHR